jgi:hypothetical protein
VTASLYFFLVFGAGFLLGPIRLFLIEPYLGPVTATLCEAPVLIVATLFAAWWSPRATGLPREQRPLILVGLIALVFQQLADLSVGVLLRDMSATAVLVHYATPEGLIYGALLVLFALMPWLVGNVAC